MNASSTHSVRGHLGVAAAAYDAEIRRFVPHYEEMLAEGVALVRAFAPVDAHVLDLGGGTGALTAALLAGWPEARATLLDIDPAMLAEARGRLAANSDRVTFHAGSFFNPLPMADAVVASLSLHHVADPRAKARVYAEVRKALPPGGLFLCLDATVPADWRLAERTMREWVAWMSARGISEPAARAHLADWAGEDHYLPLAVELALLADAGFAEPECFWRRGPTTIFGARCL